MKVIAIVIYNGLYNSEFLFNRLCLGFGIKDFDSSDLAIASEVECLHSPET